MRKVRTTVPKPAQNFNESTLPSIRIPTSAKKRFFAITLIPNPCVWKPKRPDLGSQIAKKSHFKTKENKIIGLNPWWPNNFENMVHPIVPKSTSIRLPSPTRPRSCCHGPPGFPLSAKMAPWLLRWMHQAPQITPLGSPKVLRYSDTPIIKH